MLSSLILIDGGLQCSPVEYRGVAYEHRWGEVGNVFVTLGFSKSSESS